MWAGGPWARPSTGAGRGAPARRTKKRGRRLWFSVSVAEFFFGRGHLRPTAVLPSCRAASAGFPNHGVLHLETYVCAGGREGREGRVRAFPSPSLRPCGGGPPAAAQQPGRVPVLCFEMLTKKRTTLPIHITSLHFGPRPHPGRRGPPAQPAHQARPARRLGRRQIVPRPALRARHV